MSYEGKYAEMVEQLRADGCDEYMVEKFVREEMEADEWKAGEGITEFEAFKQWHTLPDDEKCILLSSAFCHNCGLAIFAPGYNIRQGTWGLVIEGTCAKCVHRIAHVLEDLYGGHLDGGVRPHPGDRGPVLRHRDQ